MLREDELLDSASPACRVKASSNIAVFKCRVIQHGHQEEQLEGYFHVSSGPLPSDESGISRWSSWTAATVVEGSSWCRVIVTPTVTFV